MRADLDDFARVFVAHLHAVRRGKAAIVDVQIAAADVRRDELEDDAMLDLPSLRILEFGIGLFLELHLVGPHEGDGAIPGHGLKSLLGLGSMPELWPTARHASLTCVRIKEALAARAAR